MKRLTLISCMILPLSLLAVGSGVSIGNPVNGQAFEVGNQVFVEATVRQERDTKVGVVFRINGEPLGDADKAFPYQSRLWQMHAPGTYRVEATVVDEVGTPLANDSVTIYGTPVPEHRTNQYDPMRSNQDFLDQIYVDLLSREPKNAELTDYLEKLEYGMMTRVEVIDEIYKTREFKHLMTAQSAYQTIIGEWPSPQEFSELVADTRAPTEDAPSIGSDDVGDTFDTALPLSVSTVFSGVLGGYSDVDMFRFHLDEGTAVKLFTSGAFDTTASLYDEDGDLVASDDDSGDFFNFAISQMLPPGDYYLGVSGWAGTEGIYNLRFQIGNTPGQSMSSGSQVDLEAMIHALYASQTSIDRNGKPEEIPQRENARNILFSQLYISRFGRGPTLQQIKEGKAAMLDADSLESFTVAFLESKREGETAVSNLPDMRDRDEAAYLIRALLKVRPTRNRINWLLGMSFQEKTKTLLDDPFYLARFSPEKGSHAVAIGHGSDEYTQPTNSNLLNLSSSSDPEHSIADDNPFASLAQSNNGWKYLDWFGWFSDRDYPWLYHENLGWIEVKPLNTQEMWLWHNRFEWGYTGEDSYPYLYRYADKHWIRLDYEDQPGEFEIVEPDSGSGAP